MSLSLVRMPAALQTLLLEEIPRRHRGVLAWRLRTALANADLRGALLNLIVELEGGRRPRGEVSTMTDVERSEPTEAGLSPERKAVWRVLWKRPRKFDSWTPTELQALVDELEAAVVAGGAP